MTKRRPATVAGLLEAAERVFAEKGIEGASIAELCAAAGFTRGAFYSNFADKQELFFALFEQRLQLMAQIVDEQGAEVCAAPDPVGELADRLVAFGGPQQRQWFVILSEFMLLAARDGEAARRFNAARGAVWELVGHILDTVLAASGRELIRARDDAARALIGAFLGWQAQLLPERPGTATAAGGAPDPDGFATAMFTDLITGMSRPASTAASR